MIAIDGGCWRSSRFFYICTRTQYKSELLMTDMNIQLNIDAQVIGQICVMVDTVTADVREIVATGQYPVVTLLRAYDLLEALQEGLQEAESVFNQQCPASFDKVPREEFKDERLRRGVAYKQRSLKSEDKKQSAEPEGNQQWDRSKSEWNGSKNEWDRSKSEWNGSKNELDRLKSELDGLKSEWNRLESALSGYKEEYERSGERLMQVLDREVIARKAEAYMQPWKRRFDKADSEYKKAVELWEAANVAHKAQEEGGFMERWRTLRTVRKLAGFRLERKRTGNFVARTLELMQQAMLRAREAELVMYDHNVGYKCNPDVYLRIYEISLKIDNAIFK